MIRALAALVGVSALAACTYIPPTQPITLADFQASAPQPWRAVNAETGKINDIAGLQELAKAFPDSSSVHLRLLQAHFASENVPAIIREAVWLADRGYLFRPGAQDELLKVAGDTAVAAKLKDLFDRNGSAIERSTIAAVVSEDARLVESVAYDPVGKAFYASSIVSRDVFRGEGANWSPLRIVKGGSFAGLAIDLDRRILWAASGSYDPTPQPSAAFPGIIGFDLDKSEVVQRLPGAGGITPSDLHLSASGSLFASDPISGAIYTVATPPSDLAVLIPPGTIRSPQGLATSEDGSKLYVSDYRYGIAIIDLTSKSVKRLRASNPMILDGIDGLWRHGNRLIGIQNGMSPMRIVAIDLSADGLSATNLTVLEQAHPTWTEPLGGSIQGDALYYVANGQWDRFGKGGTLNPDKPPIPTLVRRLPLN
ncbi:hypothetical protein QWY75_03675 [Pontixanthobacter aestiaquae]|uniref:Uncharacterized protein n=1 Tax=Pontixanthobacter aestiaquae TaxID=1509367 RepID=A0A844Z8Q2_9SPHN|nr:hypothetical protein [Pontixanthobacter aestiaquae]MDN3645306.1 hypothetical protein [Pontixanthobacter aestiaquae]MXO83692.1 hypothetical protein [Pontixanthobacter aestiaquae]